MLRSTGYLPYQKEALGYKHRGLLHTSHRYHQPQQTGCLPAGTSHSFLFQPKPALRCLALSRERVPLKNLNIELFYQRQSSLRKPQAKCLPELHQIETHIGHRHLIHHREAVLYSGSSESRDHIPRAHHRCQSIKHQNYRLATTEQNHVVWIQPHHLSSTSEPYTHQIDSDHSAFQTK